MDTEKKYYFLRVEGTKASTAMVNALREYCGLTTIGLWRASRRWTI